MELKYRRTGQLVALLLLIGSLTLPADAQHFFPTRPKHVLLAHTTGVLTGYGIGNGTGGFSIRDISGHRTVFYLAYPTRIDGRVYNCYVPRQPGMHFDSNKCKNWPKNLIIGTTKVRITYWWQFYPGSAERVRVSDTIDRLTNT